jgi:hypothetical protein
MATEVAPQSQFRIPDGSELSNRLAHLIPDTSLERWEELVGIVNDTTDLDPDSSIGMRLALRIAAGSMPLFHPHGEAPK